MNADVVDCSTVSSRLEIPLGAFAKPERVLAKDGDRARLANFAGEGDLAEQAYRARIAQVELAADTQAPRAARFFNLLEFLKRGAERLVGKHMTPRLQGCNRDLATVPVDIPHRHDIRLRLGQHCLQRMVRDIHLSRGCQLQSCGGIFFTGCNELAGGMVFDRFQ